MGGRRARRSRRSTGEPPRSVTACCSLDRVIPTAYRQGIHLGPRTRLNDRQPDCSYLSMGGGPRADSCQGAVPRKAMITTRYSGNSDFMTNKGSWLVDFELVPIGPGTRRIPKAANRAEPEREQRRPHARDLRRPVAAQAKAARRRRASQDPFARGGRRTVERLELRGDVAARGRVRATLQLNRMNASAFDGGRAPATVARRRRGPAGRPVAGAQVALRAIRPYRR